MHSNLLIVNSIAVLLIVFVLWWFFGSHSKAVSLTENQPTTILIKNGIYQPSFITVRAGEKVHLRFVREDASACAGTISFPQLHLSYQLEIGKPMDVIIPSLSKGEFDFTCQMGMYRGKILVS